MVGQESGRRYGSECPNPPIAVISPQMPPRSRGEPRPVSEPSSERASAKPMLIPAPMEAARPTRKVCKLFWVAKAAANSGASVETEPSINPARPGCTYCSTNMRWRVSSSSSTALLVRVVAPMRSATDDTAAFRQAIALDRAVYVPQGTYRISDTLTLGKDTALIGLQPSQTRLTLLPSTAGFTDAGNPRAVIVAPAGSAPIVSGIGILLQNTNSGAMGVKWMAAPESCMDDVTISTSRTKTGNEQLYGLWITGGGAGTFRGIWTPSESATAGLVITDTANPGTMYQMSVEHHRRVEMIMRNVHNWTFYTMQTEEVSGCEGTASLEMEGCGADFCGSGHSRGSGGWQLSFSAQAGQTYQVLVADDLTLPVDQWTVLTNGREPAPSTSRIALLICSFRFYRIVSP